MLMSVEVAPWCVVSLALPAVLRLLLLACACFATRTVEQATGFRPAQEGMFTVRTCRVAESGLIASLTAAGVVGRAAADRQPFTLAGASRGVSFTARPLPCPTSCLSAWLSIQQCQRRRVEVQLCAAATQ